MGAVVSNHTTSANPRFCSKDDYFDALYVLKAVGFIEDEDVPHGVSTVNVKVNQAWAKDLGLKTQATLIATPSTNFEIVDGHPTGRLDSLRLVEDGGRVLYSISFPGMKIEDLLALDGDLNAIKKLFDKADFYDLADGNDRVSSLGGNDEVNVGGGNNIVHAGNGDDEVSAIGAASGNNQFYGEAGNDRMDGWNGRDMLAGDAGKDTLYGWANNDRLDGGKDSDRLTGGAGADILTGGAGKDVFDFNTAEAGATKATRDTITDFHRGEDKLELAQFRIDGVFGDKLAFIGTKDFSDSGQIRYEKLHGDILVEVNYEGSKAADLEILLRDVDALGRADLIL